MNFQTRWTRTMWNTRKWLAATLAIMLMTVSMSGMAYAAEDKVTGIEFQYDEMDFNPSTSSLELVVEDEKVNVAVLASISGSSSKKDVTAEATWKSSNSNYVKVEKGILTGVGKGTATISAVYNGYTVSIKASSDFMYDKVTLMEGNVEAPAKSEVELGKDLRYKLDGSKNNVVEDVTSEAVWTSSNTAIAKVDEGVVTLVGVGTVTITAKMKGKTDSISLVVSSPYKSISISPNQLLELEVGSDDRNLAATVIPKVGGSLEVTNEAKWTSGNTKVVTVEKGKVTPVAAGKTTITVSHMGVTSSIDVVVRTAYQSIKLTPEKEFHMFLQDQPLQIKAEVLSNTNISFLATDLAEWTSSNVVVATVSGGLVVPKAVGSTRITASYKGVSRSIDVQVYPSVSKLSSDVEKIDGFIESSEELPAVSGVVFDGTKIDVSKLVTWTSKDESIVTIKDGKWTAKAVGETVLTAKLGSYEVNVKMIVHVKPLKLMADVKEMSIIKGKETPYPTVMVINEDGEEENVSQSIKWKSSSDNIVLKENTIKGLDESLVTLTGTYLNKSVIVKVRIEEEIVKMIAEPNKVQLNPNRSKTIKVTGYYKDGRSVVLTSKMKWTVSSTSIAAVNGRSIKALQPGSAIITGTYQGKSIDIPLVVTLKLKSLTISDKSTSLTAGQSFGVQLTANYLSGNPVIVTDSATWTSSKSAVATIKNGKITAHAKGVTTIKATFEGKTATIRVTVK